jgi:hypothetical protein
MASVKRYQRQYGTRTEMDILRETAPTVASLLMIKPDAPKRTTNDLIPLVTAPPPQPQFSLDQLTIDFLTDPTNQSTSQTTPIVRDEPTITESNDIIAEFLNEPFLKPANGNKYLPVE